MTNAVFILTARAAREKAADWCWQAPSGTQAEFFPPSRTPPQNALMWAMLTDIAWQTLWHGEKLTPADWRLVFLDDLPTARRMVPNLKGDGLVNLNRATSSTLKPADFAALLDLIAAFAADRGVTFHKPQAKGTADAE